MFVFVLFEKNTENEVCVRERHFHWWARDREVAREPESGCRALLPCPMAHARRHAGAVSCARATAARTAKSFPALRRANMIGVSPPLDGPSRTAVAAAAVPRVVLDFTWAMHHQRLGGEGQVRCEVSSRTTGVLQGKAFGS